VTLFLFRSSLGVGIIRFTPQHTIGSSGAAESTDSAGAPEIEVTPAMIDAGAEVIWRCFCEEIPYGSSYGEHVADQVFRAMDASRGASFSTVDGRTSRS
jgi:hypothetical protein